MRCDFHCHTRYSCDSLVSPEDVVRRALKRGLEVIAITDHNTFGGVAEALGSAEKVKIVAIPGMEIRTEIGDVIGLFLSKEINSNNFRETVEQIRIQNGVVVLPHPCKSPHVMGEQIEQVDAVEIFNARCTAEENDYALQLARKFGKPGLFGSDAHLAGEIGPGYCEISGSRDDESIKRAILSGAAAIHGIYSSRWNILFSQMVRAFRGGGVPSMRGLRRFLRQGR